MKINKRELCKRRKEADKIDLAMEKYGYIAKEYLLVKLPNSMWWWIVKRGKYRHKIISRQPTRAAVADYLVHLQVVKKDEPIIVHKSLPTRINLAWLLGFLLFAVYLLLPNNDKHSN